jgi:hypothetical protein
MISRELILELREILKVEFALDLPYEKVVQIGNFLLSYFETLLSIENDGNNKNKY